MFQFTVPPSITQQQIGINFPAIFFVVIVVILLLYKFMKQRQFQPTMDESWLENVNNQ